MKTSEYSTILAEAVNASFELCQHLGVDLLTGELTQYPQSSEEDLRRLVRRAQEAAAALEAATEAVLLASETAAAAHEIIEAAAAEAERSYPAELAGLPDPTPSSEEATQEAWEEVRGRQA